ncbi:MAG: HD domain-containing protein [Candidatus Omnitrophica bacterium]|nr:HD domain-containing protein [Candidatus Omnitrophota bacterium]
MTPHSLEQEHLSNWIFADRVTRYGLIPVIYISLLLAGKIGLHYPVRECTALLLLFFLYNHFFILFLKKRSRHVLDTTVYFIILILDTVVFSAAIHFTGGIESTLVPLSAVIVMFGALFLTFFQCILVSISAVLGYVLVLGLEFSGAIPHHHIFHVLDSRLYMNGAYLLLNGFGVSSVVLTLGVIAGYLATLRRRHSEQLAKLRMRLEEWNRDLELRVEEKTRHLRAMHEQLQQAYFGTVTSFIQALGAKDLYTQGHSHSVSTYAKLIAEELGLDDERTQKIVQGCKLHDIGKIAVPDRILLKPGPLTKEEFEIIKQHPIWGARILEPLTFLKDVTEIVRQEHERWDGRGYPAGLKGDEICLGARITSVADAWDAMTSARPYRAPMTREAAIAELRRGSGSQFDPIIVDAFLRVLDSGKLPEFAPIEDVTSHLRIHEHKPRAGAQS